MHHEVAVDIDAGPADVWSALVDIQRWPEWTESMTSVRRIDEGEFRVGSEARVKQPRLREATWRVAALEPGSEFTWESSGPGIRTIGGHRIIARNDGSCRVTLSVDLHGPVAALLGAFIVGTTRRYAAMEAAGLKRRCER